ncbi:sugar diacid recognition domain-containing protein [Sporosarcina sp.]|uniref:sugar diacid recognition domain-containing protein n=1 Tax=Sporosarcina sp. TaxID=49982 RepID=UPI002615457F|nr:sugar diacid recognition domain-containing protein [Sporosarcina sp.]
MQTLNSLLANDITERTMKIINRNINVMNDKGMIISSGDKKRIQTIHEGAVTVIDRQEDFEISEQDAERLHGVKAGINLPIRFNGEIVGVIGITGNPDEIRNYGELVKMAAELILQQAALAEEIRWDERLKEEMVTRLLQGTAASDPLFSERAVRLGINLDIPRAVVILLADNETNAYAHILGKRGKDDLAVLHPDRLIFLKKVENTTDGWQEKAYLRELEQWAAEIATEGFWKLAAGTYQLGLEGAAVSYDQAVNSLIVGEKLHPDRRLYYHEEYRLPVFLEKARKLGLSDEIGPYGKQLGDHARNGELLETLTLYIEHDGDAGKTSAALFIHRNTLRYRLDRITEITGKDPRKVGDLLELTFSVLQYRMK